MNIVQFVQNCFDEYIFTELLESSPLFSFLNDLTSCLMFVAVGDTSLLTVLWASSNSVFSASDRLVDTALFVRCKGRRTND